MTKDEIVLLVSRAIAVIQCISAFEEISYLPLRLVSLHHYRGRESWFALDYFTSLYSLEVSMLCVRIAALLILAWVFWRCAPWVSRLLWPEHSGEGGVGDPQARDANV